MLPAIGICFILILAEVGGEVAKRFETGICVGLSGGGEANVLNSLIVRMAPD